MRRIGYGKGYKYAHDFEDAQVEQQNLPDAIKDRTYYHPSDRGYETTVKERLDAFEQSKKRSRKAEKA
jgi:putative ATPase